MYSRFYTIKIILIALIFLNSNIYTKNGSSKRIGISSNHKIINNFTYDIELFPGQQFTGYWYFWSDETPITANFQSIPPVAWVTMSPQSFTSSSCSDIVPTAFRFHAPSSPGVYMVSFIDFNGNWDPIDINLTVTKNPVSASIKSVNSFVNEPVERSETITIDESGLGCLGTYLPSLTANVFFSTFENVDWLKFNPQNFTLSASSPEVQVTKTFLSDSVGQFTTYEIKTVEWYTFPEFIKWNFNVKSKIDIVKPLSNDIWITGEQGIIQWSGGDSGDSVKIEFSVDDGQTYNNIAKVSNNNQQYSWKVPKALSTKCKIKISDTKNSTNFKESERFRIKGYELTRYTPDGDYELFKPEIHGWNFENRSDNVWPQSYWQQIDYVNGIDPYTNKNYPDMFNTPPINAHPSSSDYTDWISFVRAFGTDQCYYDLSVPIYKPSAIMLWALNKGAFLGGCFGFAASSIAAFDHPEEFKDYFGVPLFSNLYSVNLNEMTRNVINESYNFQWGKAQQINYFENHNKSPNEVLDELKNIFKSDLTDNKFLRYFEDGIDDFGNGGFTYAGHCVVPYKIEKDTLIPDREYIFIYDNNYPGDTTRKITILKSLNGWEDLVDGWDGRNNLFLSDPSSEFLTIPTLQLFVLPFNKYLKTTAISNDLMTVYNTPSSSITIHNTSGDSIGFNKKLIFNSLSNASPIIPETGHTHPPIGYHLTKDNYSINIHSILNKNCYAALFADSLIMMYGRDDADSTQTDNLSFGDGLLYSNKDLVEKHLNFKTIFINSTSEKMVDILDCNLSKDDSIQLKKINSDDLLLKNSRLPKIYNLNLELASSTENPKYSYEQIHLPINTTHIISPDWNNLSKPLLILEDVGNNGTIDDTLIVDNNSNPPTPVELVSFSGSIEKEGITLKWSTATEINNNGFEIERTLLSSQSEQSGEKEEFEKIGFVIGSGSTTDKKDYSFIDNNAPNGKLQYRLKQIDYNGSFSYSKVVEVNNENKLTFNLEQNYPNPFNPVTTILYIIPEKSKVQVVVYDILGKSVALLVNENQEKGIHKVEFDGSSLNSGIYFYQLFVGNKIMTKKMTLIK